MTIGIDPGASGALVALLDQPAPPVLVPIRTGCGLNGREHYLARARRVKGERAAAAWALSACLRRPALPCVVTLTRLGPSNGLDDDNLAGALKGVRDEVAHWLGVDDRKREIVRYEYRQRRAWAWAVWVEFARMEPGP